MPATSARALTLLSLLGTGAGFTAGQLAERLGTSVRTVRRDVETLRDLGYEVEADRGATGGYRLGRGARLPPVVFDEDQAVAAAVALQTVPTVLAGVRENAARALTTLRQAMPGRSRLLAEAFTVSSARNYWEFPAPAIDAEIVRAAGTAIQRRHLFAVDVTDGPGPVVLEPYELVVWAARWYLVAFDRGADTWRALRLDRIVPGPPTHTVFTPRDFPHEDAVTFVMTTPERGDRPAEWQCRGSAVLALPGPVVARFAPGGSTVEELDRDRCRLTLGAWSWAGLAGLLLTFDADLSEVEPAQLREAFGALRTRIGRSLAD